jgi:hypothetical protein
MPRLTDFGKSDVGVFRYSLVAVADFSRIAELKARVTLTTGEVLPLSGSHALEAAYILHPSVVEGQHLRFARHAWALHNLLGHPVMQLLAFCKLYKQAMWVHEVTVPKCKSPE